MSEDQGLRSGQPWCFTTEGKWGNCLGGAWYKSAVQPTIESPLSTQTECTGAEEEAFEKDEKGTFDQC